VFSAIRISGTGQVTLRAPDCQDYPPKFLRLSGLRRPRDEGAKFRFRTANDNRGLHDCVHWRAWRLCVRSRSKPVGRMMLRPLRISLKDSKLAKGLAWSSL